MQEFIIKHQAGPVVAGTISSSLLMGIALLYPNPLKFDVQISFKRQLAGCSAILLPIVVVLRLPHLPSDLIEGMFIPAASVGILATAWSKFGYEHQPVACLLLGLGAGLATSVPSLALLGLHSIINWK